MPLYEYECTQCKRRTEKIQKFSDPEITTCPHCGGLLQRVLSAPAIAFKGSGWYRDLYSSAKPPAPSPSGEGSNSESKSASTETTSGAPANSGNGAAATPSPAPAAPAATSTSTSTQAKCS